MNKTSIIEEYLGPIGRMISGSKSIYVYDNPTHLVMFNANVVIGKTKIWYGDIDLTKDHKRLKDLSKSLKKKLYVLNESDGRFQNENDPKIDRAVVTIDGDELKLGAECIYHYVKNNVPYSMTEEEIKVIRPTPIKAKSKEKAEDYFSVELPDLASLKGSKKVGSPLEQLQAYFIKEYTKDEAQKLFNNLYITDADYTILEDLVTDFAKKLHPGLHPAKIEQSVGWHMFEMAPSRFYVDPKWAKKGIGYVKKVQS